MNKPYIGITGFTDQKSVAEIVYDLEISEKLKKSNRLLMLGCLVSHRTLMGEQAANPKRYSKLEEIKKLFSMRTQHSLNIIHYNSRKPNLCDQLIAIEDSIPKLDGFQLNIVWPKFEELSKYKYLRVQTKDVEKKLRIIFQLNQSAIDLVHSDQELIDRIGLYKDVITDILWDMSGGNGKLINFDQSEKYLSLLTKEFPELYYNVAGGLNSEVNQDVKKLLAKFPNIGIDVESGVRTDDILDVNKCKQFLNNYLELM
jgi:phosphoribosylanthranilate isomerase